MLIPPFRRPLPLNIQRGYLSITRIHVRGNKKNSEICSFVGLCSLEGHCGDDTASHCDHACDRGGLRDACNNRGAPRFFLEVFLQFGRSKPLPKKLIWRQKKNCYMPDERSHGRGTRRNSCKTKNGQCPMILGQESPSIINHFRQKKVYLYRRKHRGRGEGAADGCQARFTVKQRKHRGCFMHFPGKPS